MKLDHASTVLVGRPLCQTIAQQQKNASAHPSFFCSMSRGDIFYDPRKHCGNKDRFDCRNSIFRPRVCKIRACAEQQVL